MGIQRQHEDHQSLHIENTHVIYQKNKNTRRDQEALICPPQQNLLCVAYIRPYNLDNYFKRRN